MGLVDLSAPIVATPESTPPLLAVEVEFDDHAAGAQQIEQMLGVPKELLRDGEGWAVEAFTCLQRCFSCAPSWAGREDLQRVAA